MRVIGYIDHPAYKISVFQWNEKYIIKIEAGFFEQYYKFKVDEFSSWEELKLLFDTITLDEIKTNFHHMNQIIKSARLRYEGLSRIV